MVRQVKIDKWKLLILSLSTLKRRINMISFQPFSCTFIHFLFLFFETLILLLFFCLGVVHDWLVAIISRWLHYPLGFFKPLMIETCPLILGHFRNDWPLKSPSTLQGPQRVSHLSLSLSHNYTPILLAEATQFFLVA